MRSSFEKISQKISLTFVIGTAILALCTYFTRNNVITLQHKVRKLETQIHQTQQSLSLLHSEWHVLNHPYNLRAINKKLRLHSIRPEQVSHIL